MPTHIEPRPDELAPETVTIELVQPPALPDTRPAMRKGWDAGGHWVTALALLFPIPALAVLFVLSPVIAVLALAGLAVSLLRLVVTGDGRALVRVAAGFGLFVAAYAAVRVGVAFNLSTVREWASDTRLAADGKSDLTVMWANGRVLLVYAAMGVGVAAAGWATLYALIRPHRSRLSGGTVLTSCAMVGALVALLA